MGADKKSPPFAAGVEPSEPSEAAWDADVDDGDARGRKRTSVSTYVVRNAPSDIVRSRPSSAPPVAGQEGPALPRPPRVPQLDGPVEEIVERIERFDFAPVAPRSSRPPSDAPRASSAPSAARPATSSAFAEEASTSERPIPRGVRGTSHRPVSDRPTSDRPTSDRRERPVSDRPVSDRAVSERPVSERPVSDRPVSDRPVSDRPVSESPVSEATGTSLARRPSSEARRRPVGPGRVERVRTDIDALRSPSVVPEEAPPATDPVASLLLELCRCSPGDVERHRSRLDREADRLLPELVRHFPGPVWFDRKMPYRRLPRASEASPLGAALVLLGERAVPHVEALLEHASPDVRFHAVLVATELELHDLLAAVAQLLLDPDPGVRRATLGAVEALRASSTYPHVLAGLRRTASATTVQQVWRVRSIEALGELGDALALDALIELLGDDDRTIARAAHDALRRLTCHDLGTMRMSWRRWAKSQGRRHRFEWLVDALADRRPELRKMALQDLRRVSGHDFGVTDDSPRAAFVDAQAKFVRWWQSRT